jgi:hypothetical protein
MNGGGWSDRDRIWSAPASTPIGYPRVGTYGHADAGGLGIITDTIVARLFRDVRPRPLRVDNH